MVRSRRKREKLEKKKRKEKRSFGARVTSERPSLLGGSEKERERAAGRGLLFRLLESRLVSEAGGPIGGVLPWTPRSVADQSCSIVARTCYIACRRAPPPGIARRPRVFPFVETFYATFPTTPLSLSLSLQRLRVRLSVRPSTLYICVCGSRPFVLLAKPPASSRPLHSSPSPSITLSLSLSRSSFFPLQNFSGFYGARSSDSRTLVRTYRRTPVRDTDRRGLTSTHPPPPPTPLSGVFDLNPGQWERRGRGGTVPSTTVPYGRL